MSTTQIQLKISLSQQINDLLQSKAARLGIPMTQFVKHLIIKEVDTEDFPTFQASEAVEKAYAKAKKDEAEGKLIEVTDPKKFFDEL